MENQRLKVGQQFEVVEVLTDGNFTDKTLLKIGGWTMGYGIEFINIFECIPNGKNIHQFPSVLSMYVPKEVKPVGRLTVTAIHDCESKVGDTVYHYEHGKGQVIRIEENRYYPVIVDFDGFLVSFTKDGAKFVGNPPTLSFTPYDLVNGGFSQDQLIKSATEVK